MSNVIEQRNGPDQILPATSIKTWKPDGAIKLQIAEYGPESDPPISVYTMVRKVSELYPDFPALSVKRDGKWKFWSYKEYFDNSCVVAKAFIKLGLRQLNGVCIMGFNSPEWLIANFGCIFAGGLSAGVYTTNSPEACQHLAVNCQANIILVEDEACLNKFLAVKRFLPDLKAIVQWSGVPGAPGVISWEELLAIGLAESNDALNERLSLASINQCCTLIYTSGTTGPPKGVMCSQDHLTWGSRRYKENDDIADCTQVSLSYLPLSHLAAQYVDIYLACCSATTVYFAQPDALKGSLGKTLIEVQPTNFLAVPRVWEKIYERMQQVAGDAGFIKKSIGSWAKYHGLNQKMAILEKRELSYYEKCSYALAQKLVFSKIKEAMGLIRATKCASGAAPISKDILEYFLSLDIPIMEGYGMSESLSIATFSFLKPGMFRLGSVGKVQPMTTLKLIDVDSKRKGEGEICIKGRNICMGYLQMPEKTNEAIDDGGWLHTGDIGQFDCDGFLYITGRLKELVITAGGENIPPVLIEEIIKKRLSIISNAMVVGDKLKYLTILLTLKAEVDEETGEPLQGLLPACVDMLRHTGSGATTVKEICQEIEQAPHGSIATLIQQAITLYNDHDAISNAQKLQKWMVLPHDFSQFTEELNNTLKLKRFFVHQKYADQIALMYNTPQIKSAKL